MRIAPLLPLLVLVACSSSDPCTDYATYMCDCHPEEDCEDLQTIYASGTTDVDLQESCASDLDAQQSEDGTDGSDGYDLTGECGTGGEDSGA